jgi:ATP-dependent exoDNAse (exonuclease V) alpha subunit
MTVSGVWRSSDDALRRAVKMMQIAIDYEKEMFNGDVGTIDAIEEGNSELRVLFPTRGAGVAGSLTRGKQLAEWLSSP